MSHRCRTLPWDSEFFGHRIARLDGPSLRPDEIESIVEWCQARRVECLYFLAGSNCPETITTAEQNGFGLKDLRVTYEAKSAFGTRDIGRCSGGSLKVRTSTPADLGRLVEIARVAHLDSRFFFDHRFDRERAAALYEVWIRKACANNHVLVGEVEGQPAGYFSCHRIGEHAGGIGLVAVDARCHGQGLGRAMLNAALDWFVEQEITEVRVVTQGRNVAAQRLYQGAGFRTRTVEIWYHKWWD